MSYSHHTSRLWCIAHVTPTERPHHAGVIVGDAKMHGHDHWFVCC